MREALAALAARLRISQYPSGRISSAVLAFATVTALGIPQAQAGFTLGDAANFGVLYEGNGGNTLNFNNSNITGNIGIGATGKFADAGGCAGQCLITGVVEFSAANTGQFSSSAGTTYTPALAPNVNPLYSQANVQNDLNALNSLSKTLGLETGASTTVSSGGSITASSGTLDAGGNRVFKVTSISFPNGTFTINGSASDFVVLNIAGAVGNNGLNGSVVLAGGITSDHVLFNFTPAIPAGCPPTCTAYDTDYTNLSGGPTMTISTNGLTTTGTFLDPTGTIQINHSVLNGRLFGGDTGNMQIVSGANIVAPPASRVPEPGSLALLGAGMVALGIIRRLHRPAVRSGPLAEP